ncbi:MAG: hypothetical protein JWP75_3656 [Frondihabitans sp.]|nr:hypothetical protein [Frondihabitans sp.]
MTGYLKAWQRLPGELGFLLAALPVSIAAFATVWVVIAVGVGLSVLWIGIPIVIGALLVARRFGSFELHRLERAGRPPVERPDWSDGPEVPATERSTSFARFRRRLSDGRSWLAFVHSAVVELALSCVTFTLAVPWVMLAVAGTTYPAWIRLVPPPDLSSLGEISAENLGTVDLGVVAATAAGIIALITLPLVVHGLVLLHDLVARAMLGEWSSAALRREIAASEASRESALLAEDTALRRLERDIHDGPQQSLLRIQYDLASAGRRLGDDHEAKPLVDGALQLTKETLKELREIGRGLAPPLLQDRGLVSAVTALGARSVIPVTTTVTLDGDPDTLVDVERSAYFVVSELLANVTKHSGASEATVALQTRSTALGRDLCIDVTDNGEGGAVDMPDHGLAGLRQRLDGLRGTLDLTSPPGGPTRVTVVIPLR